MDVRVREPEAARPLVLVVEDDAINRKLMVRAVESFGAFARAAADGHEALEAAADRPYDLVLMDLGLPGLNGYEAARALRERGYEGRIIAVTGMLDRGDLPGLQAQGFDGLMIKPVDMQDLQTCVDAVARAA